MTKEEEKKALDEIRNLLGIGSYKKEPASKSDLISKGIVNFYDLKHNEIKERVFFCGNITERMMLRIQDEENYNTFQCGVDLIKTENGYIAISNVGCYGFSLIELFENILKNRNIEIDNGYFAMFCDDPELKSIWNNVTEDYDLCSVPSTIIEDGNSLNRILRGIREIKFKP